jgi:excisionase family DNA binding protein
MITTPDTGSERWISVRAASDRLGISRHTMRRLVQRGIVRTRRLPGTHPLVSEADVDRLARDHTSPPRDA